MPIDARIPLGVQTFQAPDPLETMAKITGLRGAQQRQQINQMQVEGMQGAAQADQKLRELFSRPTPPAPEEIFSIVGPEQGAKIVEGLSALQAQQFKTEGELRQNLASAMGSLNALPETLRPEVYQVARQKYLTLGIPEAELPEQYDPSVSDRFLRGAMTPQQQYGIAHPPAPDDYTLGDQRFSGATNQPVATAAVKPAPTPTNLDAAILEAERRGDTAAVERYMGLKERIAKAGRAPAQAPQPSYQWAADPKTGESRLMTAEEIRAAGAGKPPTSGGGLGAANVQLRNQRTAAALNSIEQLKKLAPKRTPGPMGILEGMGEVAKGYAGYSSKTRQFQAMIQPTAMQMAAAIQGAANLSDNERKAMAEMLGSINTMDYETQLALLDQAGKLLENGADVEKVGETWRPRGQRRQPVAPTEPPTKTKVGRFEIEVSE